MGQDSIFFPPGGNPTRANQKERRQKSTWISVIDRDTVQASHVGDAASMVWHVPVGSCGLILVLHANPPVSRYVCEAIGGDACLSMLLHPSLLGVDFEPLVCGCSIELHLLMMTLGSTPPSYPPVCVGWTEYSLPRIPPNSTLAPLPQMSWILVLDPPSLPPIGSTSTTTTLLAGYKPGVPLQLDTTLRHPLDTNARGKGSGPAVRSWTYGG